MGIAELKSLPSPARLEPRYAAASGSVVDVRGVGQILRRRWHWIVAPAIGLGVLTLVVAMLLPSRYEATTKILFDPRNLQVFQNDIQAHDGNADDTGAQAESQVQVITSADVLGRVIGQLRLESDPDFGDPPSTLLGATLGALHSLLGQKSSASDPFTVALRALQHDIKVKRLEKTFILEVTVETPDAQKSAAVANAVAQAFLSVSVAARTDETQRSSEALTARLDALRDRVAQSEEAVETFRKGHNLVGANGKPVVEQQLTELNNQLTLARARRTEQQARVDTIRNIAAHGAAPDTLTEGNLSPLITSLKEQLVTAQRQETEANLTYGPLHPARIAAAAQVQAARDHLKAEIGRLTQTAQSDLERAKLGEADLAQRVEALKTANAGANESLVRLRGLELEAASNRGLYETFLNRAKDLQQRSTLDTVDARVLTPAVAPISKSGPSSLLLAIAGGMFGGLLGVGAALVGEQFDETVRSPRQLAAEMDVPVLAVLRSASDMDDPGLWAMRQQLGSELLSRQARVVLLAAVGRPAAGIGFAQNLARSSEFDSGQAVLIDGDDDRRELTRSLQGGARPPARRATAGLPTQDTTRLVDGIRFIPAGTPWAEFAGMTSGSRGIDSFARDARMIVIYGGTAAAAGARLRVLAAVADDVVLVVEAGHAALSDLRAAVRSLGPEQRRLRGLVLTGAVENS